jgi:hypothetical protein
LIKFAIYFAFSSFSSFIGPFMALSSSRWAFHKLSSLPFHGIPPLNSIPKITHKSFGSQISPFLFMGIKDLAEVSNILLIAISLEELF